MNVFVVESMFFLLGNSLIDTGFTGFQLFSTHEIFNHSANLKADPDEPNVGGTKHFRKYGEQRGVSFVQILQKRWKCTLEVHRPMEPIESYSHLKS